MSVLRPKSHRDGRPPVAACSRTRRPAVHVSQLAAPGPSGAARRAQAVQKTPRLFSHSKGRSRASCARWPGAPCCSCPRLMGPPHGLWGIAFCRSSRARWRRLPRARPTGRVFFGGLVALCPAGCQMLELVFFLPVRVPTALVSSPLRPPPPRSALFGPAKPTQFALPMDLAAAGDVRLVIQRRKRSRARWAAATDTAQRPLTATPASEDADCIGIPGVRRIANAPKRARRAAGRKSPSPVTAAKQQPRSHWGFHPAIRTLDGDIANLRPRFRLATETEIADSLMETWGDDDSLPDVDRAAAKMQADADASRLARARSLRGSRKVLSVPVAAKPLAAACDEPYPGASTPRASPRSQGAAAEPSRRRPESRKPRTPPARSESLFPRHGQSSSPPGACQAPVSRPACAGRSATGARPRAALGRLDELESNSRAGAHRARKAYRGARSEKPLCMDQSPGPSAGRAAKASKRPTDRPPAGRLRTRGTNIPRSLLALL